MTTIEGYELSGDPKSAIEYPGNALIFAGEVVGRELPRKVEGTVGSDIVEYVYTPIFVRIGESYMGAGLSQGEQVMIRALGGQLGSEETVSTVGPAPEDYRLGMRLVLFTQEFVDAGDGMVGATPNFVYVEDGNGSVYNLQHPEHETSRSVLLSGIAEWAAFNH